MGIMKINTKVVIPDELWKKIKPHIPPRTPPLGNGRWSDKDFFDAIVTRFSTKIDWDDLEKLGCPPGKILYQQFIEWRERKIFGLLSVLDLDINGAKIEFKIEKLIKDPPPRHVRQYAEARGINPETVVRPDMSKYPRDPIEDEINAKFPWLAENRKRVDAMMEQFTARLFTERQQLKCASREQRLHDSPGRWFS